MVLALAVAWRDLRLARGELATARATLVQVLEDPATLEGTAGRASALERIRLARRRIGVAHSRLEGSAALTLARFVPVVSGQRSAALSLVTDAGRGVAAGESLLHALDTMAGRTIVQGGVPIDALSELGARLQAGSAAFGGLVRSPAGLWGGLGRARRDFDRVAAKSARRLREASDALVTARTFVGGSGDRRYLVALENNAEMRDQGMVLSYGFVRFHAGQASFERTGHITDLTLSRPAPTPVPPGTAAVFGFISPTVLWQSVNATADFGWSGRAMAAMALQATKQPVDGVIAVDVPALARLLAVVGPVPVAGLAEPLTRDNAARVLLHDQYAGLKPDEIAPARVARQAEATLAVMQRLLGGAHDAVELGRQLGEAAAGGHLRLWSADDREERVFERSGLGGGPAASLADRTFHVAVENRTVNKLDYYVGTRIAQRIRITPRGAAQVLTTVRIDNRAPAGEKPSYQLGPDEFTKTAGNYLGWLLFWGPAGAEEAGSRSESGLNLYEQTVPVPAGEHREIVVATVIPNAVRNGRLDLRHVPQPRLEPAQLEATLEAPGWVVSGPRTIHSTLDRIRTLSWSLRR